jgi:hypothetical protein
VALWVQPHLLTCVVSRAADNIYIYHVHSYFVFRATYVKSDICRETW